MCPCVLRGSLRAGTDAAEQNGEAPVGSFRRLSERHVGGVAPKMSFSGWRWLFSVGT